MHSRTFPWINSEFFASLDRMPLKAEVPLSVYWLVRLTVLQSPFKLLKIMFLCCLFEGIFLQEHWSSIMTLPTLSVSLQINIWLPLQLTRLPCLCWQRGRERGGIDDWEMRLGVEVAQKKKKRERIKGKKKLLKEFHSTFLLLQFKLRKQQHKDPCSPFFFSYYEVDFMLLTNLPHFFFTVCLHHLEEWAESNTLISQSRTHFYNITVTNFTIFTGIFLQRIVLHYLKDKDAISLCVTFTLYIHLKYLYL